MEQSDQDKENLSSSVQKLHDVVNALREELKHQSKEAKKSGGDSKWWKIMVIVLPILLTAVFSFMINDRETRLREEIAKKQKVKSTSLDITKVLYNTRLNMYIKIYEKVLALEGQVSIHEGTAGMSSALIESSSALYQICETNRLIISDGLYGLLGELWSEPWKLKEPDADRSKIVQRCLSLVTDCVAQMKQELYINELGDFNAIGGS